MTVTALRIANFKAFGGTQRVPLRPLTLVYGANSASKSSILQALAPAHHSVETGELDTQRTKSSWRWRSARGSRARRPLSGTEMGCSARNRAREWSALRSGLTTRRSSL